MPQDELVVTALIEPPAYAAVVLTGGTSARLDGIAKATLRVGGSTLLEHALDAVSAATDVVVVGDPTSTSRSVSFTRENPAYGGPAAALLAGRDALEAAGLLPPGRLMAVLACDMPLVTADTMLRLLRAADPARTADGVGGSVLIGPDGRRQLALVLDPARLAALSPDAESRTHLPVHRLLAGLDLVEVPATGAEHRDVDTWADVRDLSG